jgi:hypothetical protein
VSLLAPSTGIYVETYGDSTQATGVGAVVVPETAPAKYQYGFNAVVSDASKANHGVLATAKINSVPNSESNNGVSGQAQVSSPGSAVLNRGGYFLALQNGNAVVQTNVGSENRANGGNTALGVQANATATASTLKTYGAQATAVGGTQANYGVYATANTSLLGTGTNYGLFAAGSNGSTNYGSYCQANGANGAVNYGVKGVAMSGAVNYGIHGTAPVDTMSWAGYFSGKVRATGYMMAGLYYTNSDASIKTDVEELQEAEIADRLSMLVPRKYRYTPEAQERFGMPGTEQYGFIAQELEAVLPELVSSSMVPAEMDSAGMELAPVMHLKAVNYQGLIPLLVMGYQQQRATIAAMQAQLDACCAAEHPGMGQRGGGDPSNAAGMESVREQRLTIQPNPFTDHTTLGYYVPRAGRVSLQVATSDGKPLGTLREESAEPGAYTYEWNTGNLASGVYFCTYILDGAVVVKRTVKVVR